MDHAKSGDTANAAAGAPPARTPEPFATDRCFKCILVLGKLHTPSDTDALSRTCHKHRLQPLMTLQCEGHRSNLQLICTRTCPSDIPSHFLTLPTATATTKLATKLTLTLWASPCLTRCLRRTSQRTPTQLYRNPPKCPRPAAALLSTPPSGCN